MVVQKALSILFFIYGAILSGQEQKYTFGLADDTTNNFVGKQAYNMESGAGWDAITNKHISQLDDCVCLTKPSYFSVMADPGNYLVKIVLASPIEQTQTTIKAESRRLLGNNLIIEKGSHKEVTYLVHKMDTVINDTLFVKLKDREKRTLNWDHKLTLEFLGTTCIKSISITPTSSKTIFLAGDSTVTDQDLEPWAAWGQFLPSLTKNICIANYAASGASLHSFRARNRMAKILSQLKQGDYVFIQFAHNDEKRKGQNIGPYSSFTNYLKEYVNAIRKKGGQTVLFTPIQRRFFNNKTQLKATHGEYPNAIRIVAKEMQVPLIDLTHLTTKMLVAWGPEESKKAYVHLPENSFPNQTSALADDTHFTNFGAFEIAMCVAYNLKESSTIPASYFIKDLPNYDAAFPKNYKTFEFKTNSRFENTKPYGN
ncbi:hypothetical protein BUL40_13055 [Croceivirga radicis]|uniref:SGNH hydrolase-type esterase domain-containing protein n=1 Tax=Croceivirga radicis TaxID=1929488 RepID=A0A1V6LP95_9FLAO|nr:rhamnogalacturonan acetylesterase [Croceivirga radicis]OQD42030.1 hypothetical protein BUL40_13055 [Croceivirga radicis]